MTQASQNAETPEQAESRRWDAYMVTLTNLHEAWQLREEAWHKYIASEMKDEAAYQEWRRCSDLQSTWMEREKSALALWRRFAYPLYNLAHLLHDEDEE